jgi:hypothetical protein
VLLLSALRRTIRPGGNLLIRPWLAPSPPKLLPLTATARRAIGRQQNKGGSLHALHDRLFHGKHGPVRLHTLERQCTQAHCLHLVADAIVYWNTIYTRRAVDDLPHEPIGDELAGLTPTIFEHVNPLGTYTFDTDRPAGQLRPLRAASAA